MPILATRTAIVTGASRGIGASIAVAFAKEGANVLLVSRSMPKSEILEQLEAAAGNYMCCIADLSQMASIPLVIGQALANFEHIDILVNNAGIVRRSAFLESTEDDWDAVLTLNLKVPVFLAQACAQQMVRREKGGKIINICSLLSFQGGVRVTSYTAAKHALAGVTKAMANELAPMHIQVNGIAPGYIHTENTSALQNDPDRYKAILERIPEERWGEPDDIVGAALFLASDQSSYLQGHILTVDGGWMGR